MSEVKIEKMSIVEKILAFVKGGNESRVSSFVNYTVKQYEKTISNRKKAITKQTEDCIDELERMNDILNDFIEEQESIILSVDVDKIKTRDDIESYFQDYDYKVSRAIAKVEEQKQLIEAYKESSDKKIKGFEEDIRKTELKLSHLK